MAFTTDKSLVFTDSMQFINFSLDALVKNLSEIDFNYLTQECTGEQLKLAKQKGVYPYKYMDSFKKFFEDKVPDRCKFYSSLKDGYVSEKDNLHAINVGMCLK